MPTTHFHICFDGQPKVLWKQAVKMAGVLGFKGFLQELLWLIIHSEIHLTVKRRCSAGGASLRPFAQGSQA